MGSGNVYGFTSIWNFDINLIGEDLPKLKNTFFNTPQTNSIPLMIDDDYEKIKREIVFEKAAKAIKEDPKGKIVREILRRQVSEPDSIDSYY